MIKYCGRAVAFVQYVPANPIKHGIKFFCVCCAVSGIMLACEVYCGNKDEKTDGTSVQVCDRLVKEAELTRSRGRTLYTDNYYTSIKLAKHLFEKYRWTLVGTIVPTDKKTREDHDIPFLKLSNSDSRSKINLAGNRSGTNVVPIIAIRSKILEDTRLDSVSPNRKLKLVRVLQMVRICGDKGLCGHITDTDATGF